MAEKFADGLAELTELQALFCSPSDDEMEGCYADGPDAAWAAKASAYRASWCARYTTLGAYPPGAQCRSPSDVDYRREQSAQGRLLRDIFGNPFRTVAVDPTWRTARVLEHAQMIYDARAFDRLPILADDLQQAGCSDAAILAHCREPGEHVRGCWVVDLLLDRM